MQQKLKSTHNVFLINPSRTIQKNSHMWDDDLNEQEVFFNFGLFSIHQYLYLNNIVADLIDCQEMCPADNIFDKLPGGSLGLFCISVISAFNGPHTNKILQEVKSINENNIVIIGGQHYIGHLGEDAFRIFPGIDVVVCGEGEESIFMIVKQWEKYGNDLSKWDLNELSQNCLLNINKSICRGVLEYRVCDMRNIDFYDYSLNPTANIFFPSIEYSRGCPYNCTFCANTKLNRRFYRVRCISSICESIKNLLNNTGRDKLKFYMQASNFTINNEDAEMLCSTLGNTVEKIEWRTEMRVDTYQPGVLQKLYGSGLRVIDLGIDSASHEILQIMRKSSCPKDYLEKAILLMKEANELGIFCKVNMLIHPGDTPETIAHTEKWLIANKNLISAISVSPTLIFPGSELDSNFEHYQKTYGTRKLKGSDLAEYGVYEVDLSFDLTHKEAKEFSVKISRMINRKEKYAYAKSFGYHKVIDTSKEIMRKLPSSQFNKTTPFLN